MKVVVPYAPRTLQKAIHRELKRFNVAVCHRRFGKTVLAINELIKGACTCQRLNPRFAYIAPQQNQGKRIAWDYILHYARPIPGAKFNHSELRVDFPNGGRVLILGAKDADNLRGMYLDGAVIDEPAQMERKAWTEVLRPSLADRKGWALFIGTPKGKDAFWEIYDRATRDKDWHAVMYKASETDIIEVDELASIRREMDENEYEQEMECSFEAAIVGAYYGKLMKQLDEEGRICAVPHDPSAECWTAWDLGIGDDMAIWVGQFIGRGEVHFIDYIRGTGEGLSYYVDELRKRPYVYADGGHILPHDAQARELGTGRTRVQELARLGIRARVLPAAKVDDGISAVRALLPRCWFDAEKCQYGIESLKQYRREWDDRGGVFRSRPLHDWASHGADAMRYFAEGAPHAKRLREQDTPKRRRYAEHRTAHAGWMGA